MDLMWCRNEIYESSNGNIRGSQTECDVDTDGTFSCTPQPMGFCYAHVTLGFHALENKQVKVVLGDVERTFFGGPATMQVTSLGRRDNTVDFDIQCSNGEPCLEDRLAIMNILFRCD
ncbi:uncharacterized protein LOC132727903 isoform X2 [Ruditapes philippinarum]|uniref:uncharacterized protein LOC132727903 isoform X2 n=1 Tax=Ruditapes philippinarum TaxID=129788 RepID=UPI00295BD561|nr:uncharacterized protein LOC132727903 isoform X2 [Ruditapes philippinarum]